jgi:hypothetical protein
MVYRKAALDARTISETLEWAAICTVVNSNSYNTLLERLAPGHEDGPSELGQLIQREHAVVRQRHLARQQDRAPADQPDIRDGGWERDTGEP